MVSFKRSILHSLLGITLLGFFSSIQAQIVYQVLIDLDNDPSTGCSVAVQDTGESLVVNGFERVFSITVQQNPAPPTVSGTSIKTCDTGTGLFGAPSPVSSSSWPVGLNNGSSGGDVIEAVIPGNLVSSSGPVRIVITALASNGGSDVVRTAISGGDIITQQSDRTPIPTLSEWGLILLSLLLIAAALHLMSRRYPNSGGKLLSLILVASCTILLYAANIIPDGNVNDWVDINPVATDPSGDATQDSNSADILAVFVERGSLAVRIDVTDVENEPPEISDHNFSIDENKPSGTSLGSVTASDPDAGQSLAFSITGGNTGGAFAINSSTGELTVANSSALDFETTPNFSLTVQVTDNGSPQKSASATVTVDLNDVNDGPMITSASAVNVQEGQTAVIDIQATDPEGDTEGAGLTYAITGGADQSKFSINPNTGVLTFISASDFEIPGDADTNNQYEVQITVTDSAAKQGTLDMLVTVTNQNEGPSAQGQTLSVQGNVGIQITNAAVGLLNGASDPDSGDVLSILDSQVGLDLATTNGGTINIANDGTFTYSPPAGFSGADTFSFTIEDGLGLQDSKTATFNVNSELIWFVDGSLGNNTTGNGTLAKPFATLDPLTTGGSADTLDGIGQPIFVYNGPVGGIAHLNAFVFEDSQLLIGDGLQDAGAATINDVLGFTTLANSLSLPAVNQSSNPFITSLSDSITLAQNNTIRGLDIGNSSGTGITGSSFGTLSIDDVEIFGTGNILNLETGTITDPTTGDFTFANLTSTGGGTTGIILDSVGGSFTVDGMTSITNASTLGMDVHSSPLNAAFDFGATTVAGTTDNGIGLTNNHSSCSFTFDSLNITTDNGSGLFASNGGTISLAGTSNTISTSGGPALDLTSVLLGGTTTFSSVISVSSASDGINLDNVSQVVTINGGTITGAAGIAVDINARSTDFTYTGSIGAGNGRSVEVTNQNAGTVLFAGSVDEDGSGIFLGFNAGGTVSFAGGLDLDPTVGTAFTGTNGGTIIVIGATNSILAPNNQAVELDSVSTNITFSSISTSNSSGEGIQLTNLGSSSVFQVTGTTSVTNSAFEGILISSLAATAIDIDFGTVMINNRNTTGILADNIGGTTNFGPVTIGNPNNVGGYGIRIEDSSASFDFSSVTISATVQTVAVADAGADGIPDNDGDGDAIFLKNNTGSASFNGGTLSNLGTDGIDIRNSGNLTLKNMTIEDIGTGSLNPATISDAGIFAINLIGTNLIQDTIIRRAQSDQFDEHIRIRNSNTSIDELRLNNTDISNSTAGSVGNILGSNGFLFEATDNMNATVIIENDSNATGIRLSAWNFLIGDGGGGSGDIDVVIDNSVLDPNGLTVISGGTVQIGVATDIQIGVQDNYTVNYHVSNNTLQNVQVGLSTAGVISNNSTGSSSVNGRILNNTINDIRGRRGINLIGQSSLAGYSITVAGNIIDDLAQENVSGVNLFTAEALGIQVKGTITGAEVRVMSNDFGVTTPVGNGSSQEGIFFQTQENASGRFLIADNRVFTGSLGTQALEIDVEDNSNVDFSVLSNTLSGDGQTSSSETMDTTTEDAGSVLCLDLDNNTAVPGNQVYDLNENSGSFSVEALATLGTRNTGVPNVGAGIANAASCSMPSGVILATNGISQIATVSTAFSNLQVTVRNGDGSASSGQTVSFAAPGSGASGIFPSGNTCVTNGSGICSVLITADGTPGAYKVQATGSGLESANFYLRNMNP